MSYRIETADGTLLAERPTFVAAELDVHRVPGPHTSRRVAHDNGPRYVVEVGGDVADGGSVVADMRSEHTGRAAFKAAARRNPSEPVTLYVVDGDGTRILDSARC